MNEFTDFNNVIAARTRFGESGFGAVAQVEAYWQALGNGAVPLRSELDPRGIENALEYAFIAECVAPGVARFRVAGMHLQDLVGSDVRGMPISVVFTGPARAHLGAVVQAVCDGSELVELDLTSGRGIGRGPMRARMLLAPLRDETGAISQVLGCMQSIGQIGRQPRHFDLSAIHARALVPGQEPTVPAFPAAAPPAAQQPPQAPTAGEAGPFLRLVADNS